MIDIVTTLRRESFYQPTSRINEFGKPQLGFELTRTNLLAADEIERLRAELVSTTNKLTAERDEARRMVCGLDADIMEDQVEYAKHRGWDCFKEKQ